MRAADVREIFRDVGRAGSSAFSWYALRHGAMLGGTDQTTVRHDLTRLPKVVLRF